MTVGKLSTSLSLNLLISKMGIIILLFSIQGCKEEIRVSSECLAQCQVHRSAVMMTIAVTTDSGGGGGGSGRSGRSKEGGRGGGGRC